MTDLTKPDFKLASRPPNSHITEATWWLWLHLDKLEPSAQLGGILANKKGYHNTGQRNLDSWPGNYSIRDAPDRTGPWWKNYASALDWTFPDAQRGDFRTIDKYTSRLLKSAQDAADPRLDMVLVEFYGQADNDRTVEGYDERDEHTATSDSSHLWHLHFSFTRSKVGDFWGMWALLTVLMGWNVAKWRASLPGSAPKPPAPKPPVETKVPHFRNGSRENSVKGNNVGTDVATLQRFIGPARAGKADGHFGPGTEKGVRWYQKERRLKVDGVAGPKTWAPILRALG